jgi:uncharacterized protein YjbJ (UPF0337 family)
MGLKDKLSNKVEELRGKGKEALGGASGSPRKLEDEGKRDQASAAAKNAGEHVKDAAGKAKEAAEHAKDRLTGD